MANIVVDSYLVYQFLKRLTTPFEETKAYDLGIIDAKGRVLKKKSSLTTSEEKDAWGFFDVLVNNMKKILAKVPGGRSKMGLYAASALLFKEHSNLVGKTDYEMMLFFEEYLNEQIIDKHEVSGKVVIDGHVFSDAGKSGRSTYGRYSVKDPDYKKDPDEVGMHRNYKRPSSLSFSTLHDAKKWVKTQPKKSPEEIDRIHKKHSDFEKSMNEEVPANIVGDGKVAGLGVGPQGEPPKAKARLMKKIQKRKELE